MKKFFKIVWKSLLAVVAVAVVFIGVRVGCAWHEHYNSYYIKRWLSEDVMVRYYYHKDVHKVYNTKLKKVTLKDFDNVVGASEGDSLTVFFKDGLRGFLNAKTGEVVIPAQYKKAWIFSEGLAAVMDHSGKIGFINKDNETVLPFVYDYREEWPIDYYFSNGCCVMTDGRGACGVINKEGNWVMEPQYDSIWKLYFGKYRVVKEGDKYGMIDENLNFVFPIEYDKIEFAEHEHEGVLLTKDHVKQHVAFDGTVIEPFVVDWVENLYYVENMEVPVVVKNDYGENNTLQTDKAVLSDYAKYEVDSSFGVIHRKTGKVILPALYDNVDMVSPTLFKVKVKGTSLNNSALYDIQGRRIDNEVKP